VAFAYYDRLSRRDQAVYRRSDAVVAITLEGARQLASVVEALRAALARDDVRTVATASAEIAGRISRALGAPGGVSEVVIR
jgi:hypothetical protein